MTEADLRLDGLARLDALGPLSPARQALAFFLRRALTHTRLKTDDGDPELSMGAALAALAAPGSFTLTDAVTHRDTLVEAGWQGDEPTVTVLMTELTKIWTEPDR